MQKLLLIAIAGGLGSLSRYSLAGAVQRLFGASFPAGTFVVNITGCFLFGLVWGFLEGRLTLGPAARMIALTGFMGAFTTFSTFIFESVALLNSSQWLFAALNITGQIVLGILLLAAGLYLGKLV
ncbi:fluoride efflux transporter FluC [Oleidesulfovibrio alaskensis]|uniref:fluoride efflux transporter FluC n=1 Tax=Oleidesulfovibrio alaskensis TaxID=58180 RepID=UPI000402DEF6|nr:CrcB family protein [Oleidesulfovibrio alaskensis]